MIKYIMEESKIIETTCERCTKQIKCKIYDAVVRIHVCKKCSTKKNKK